MDKNLDKFESFIKQSMDNFEAPINEASWASIAQGLSNTGAPDVDFDSFIKDSMENYEVSYNEASWNAIEQNLSNMPAQGNFESFVKNSMENYEVAYNEPSWNVIERSLPTNSIPFYKTRGFIGGSIAALFIAGIVWYSNTENETKLDILNGKMIENKDSHDNSSSNHSISLNPNTTNNVSVNPEFNDYKPAKIGEIDVPNQAQPNQVIKLDVNKTNSAVTNSGKTENNSDNTTSKTFSNQNGTNNANQNGGSKGVSSTNNPTTQAKFYSANFVVNKTYCEGDEIVLTANVSSNEILVEWYVDNKFISNKKSFIYKANANTNEVKLVGKDYTGEIVCEATRNIIVLSKPDVSLLVKKDDKALINNYEFSLNEKQNSSLKWSFGDGEISNTSKAMHTYPKQGTFNLTCLINNEEGCSILLEQKVIVDGYYNIRQEHFFSPDGDGSLDLFLPEELKVINQPFTMKIYTRGGQFLYQTTNLNNGWNGTNTDGSLVEFGAYVWVINLKNELGYDETYKGTVIKASN